MLTIQKAREYVEDRREWRRIVAKKLYSIEAEMHYIFLRLF